jgi:murein DD-endopeptidase MepM/ murein hydrolase activator NlpD
MKFWRKKQETNKEKEKLIHRLRAKFRLVIMNDSTFEERFSLMLSPMNIFIWFGTFIIVLVVVTTLIIAYTPLREFIPGYPDSDDRKQAQRNEIRADSLEKELGKYDAYLRDINILLSGGDFDNNSGDTISNNSKETKVLDPSKAEMEFREKMREEEKMNASNLSESNENTNNSLTGILFFTPLEGQISQSFERKSGHLGLDIVGAKNDPIKSTLDGTIIFADWTTDGGHEIHIQHSNNIVSVYKHNSYLLKKTGDRVRAGDPVAIMGNTGSQTDGAHLHFEIWVNGKPVDPQNYLAL